MIFIVSQLGTVELRKLHVTFNNVHILQGRGVEWGGGCHNLSQLSFQIGEVPFFPPSYSIHVIQCQFVESAKISSTFTQQAHGA